MDMTCAIKYVKCTSTHKQSSWYAVITFVIYLVDTAIIKPIAAALVALMFMIMN